MLKVLADWSPPYPGRVGEADMRNTGAKCFAIASALILLLKQLISAGSVRLITRVHLLGAVNIHHDISDEGRSSRLAIDPVESSMNAVWVGAVLSKPEQSHDHFVGAQVRFNERFVQKLHTIDRQVRLKNRSNAVLVVRTVSSELGSSRELIGGCVNCSAYFRCDRAVKIEITVGARVQKSVDLDRKTVVREQNWDPKRLATKNARGIDVGDLALLCRRS